MKRLLLLSLCLCFHYIAVSQSSCPRKEIDCKGLCGRFVDKDSDGYCDIGEFSQDVLLKKKAKEDSIAKVQADLLAWKEDSLKKSAEKNKTIQREPANTSEQYAVKLPMESHSNNAAEAIKTSDGEPIYHEKEVNSDVKEVLQQPEPQKKKASKPYSLFLITGGILIGYLITWLLYKNAIITKKAHRQIWNILLLLTFVVSGLLGLVLVFQINYDLGMPIFRDLLYWHVQFGIGMAIISIIHIIWHLNYYAKAFLFK